MRLKLRFLDSLESASGKDYDYHLGLIVVAFHKHVEMGAKR
jgi:hypothetical protein